MDTDRRRKFEAVAEFLSPDDPVWDVLRTALEKRFVANADAQEQVRLKPHVKNVA